GTRDNRLERPPRLERGVAAAAEVQREQPGMAEPLGHRTRGKSGGLAQRSDGEPLDHFRQRMQLGPRAQQRDRERGEEVAYRGLDRLVGTAALPGTNLPRCRV